jgi:hypothetical protein
MTNIFIEFHIIADRNVANIPEFESVECGF